MLVTALKWLTRFIETRFPEKLDPANVATKRDCEFLAEQLRETNRHVEEMKKQIEILNLRVGLTRPTQSAFGRKLNG